MQFMTSLFGGSAGTLLNAAFALGIVLVLIVLRPVAAEAASPGPASGLAAATTSGCRSSTPPRVDGKRKVMIIRRDNVEHVDHDRRTAGSRDRIRHRRAGAPADGGAPLARRPPPPRAPNRLSRRTFATPITPDRPVSRDTVDRLRDLTRPAPLTPRVALRHTALLRPVGPDEKPGLSPWDPSSRVDNSGGPLRRLS